MWQSICRPDRTDHFQTGPEQFQRANSAIRTNLGEYLIEIYNYFRFAPKVLGWPKMHRARLITEVTEIHKNPINNNWEDEAKLNSS